MRLKDLFERNETDQKGYPGIEVYQTGTESCLTGSWRRCAMAETRNVGCLTGSAGLGCCSNDDGMICLWGLDQKEKKLSAWQCKCSQMHNARMMQEGEDG
jgi:hypothetical protein